MIPRSSCHHLEDVFAPRCNARCSLGTIGDPVNSCRTSASSSRLETNRCSFDSRKWYGVCPLNAALALAKLVESVQPDLLKQHPDQAAAIQELAELAKEIERTKDQHKKTAKAEAMQAMQRLKQADANEFRSYVDDLQKTDDPS